MSKQQQWMRNRPDGPLHKPDISCESNGCWPVAVIDVEDREQVERLVKLLADSLNWGPHNLRRDTYCEPLQAALREFVNPKPSKPDEPQGLGAVVEDADGTKWISHDSVPLRRRWINTDDCETRYRAWDEIHAASILTDGWVQP